MTPKNNELRKKKEFQTPTCTSNRIQETLLPIPITPQPLASLPDLDATDWHPLESGNRKPPAPRKPPLCPQKNNELRKKKEFQTPTCTSNRIWEKNLRSHQENDNSYSPARKNLEEKMLASMRGNADPEDEEEKQNMGETANIDETFEAMK